MLLSDPNSFDMEQLEGIQFRQTNEAKRIKEKNDESYVKDKTDDEVRDKTK